ncbi:hypothetical protein M1L60_02165 [Actinoplanes sp. TRM 88003]|uniref:MarR family transcriptional regulator n=1 Tax=Paractinoplanes aksuensis TaxID=2939490 RepID=A0ABT1DH38_9ACTN|nr:hypothetical protein [Actinoplanes aksuensis]MCO8269391.1 hypothetical protein [Actinoplanes aksuensis]
MTPIPFGAQLIGRTEKALNALLERALAGTGLTEPQWVALTLTVTAEGADPTPRIAHSLRIGEPAAGRRLTELADLGLVRAAEPTAHGRAVWQAVRTQTGRATDELWGDLPEADRLTAARVLNTVLARADAVLA